MKKLGLSVALACAVFATAVHGEDLGVPKPSAEELKLGKQLEDAQIAQDWTKMEQVAQQLLAGHPDNWEYHVFLGAAQQKLGDESGAMQSFDTGIKLATSIKSPSRQLRDRISTVYAMEGTIRISQGRTQEAVDLLTKAVPYAADPAAAWVMVADAQVVGHDFDGALASAAKANALKPDLPDPYFLKGMILVNRSPVDPDGKHICPEGREALKTYLSLAPKGTHAEQASQRLFDVEDDAPTPVPP